MIFSVAQVKKTASLGNSKRLVRSCISAPVREKTSQNSRCFNKPETLPQIRAFGSRVTTANRALPFLYLSRLVSGGFLGLQASSTVTTSHRVGKLQSQFGVLPRSPRCTVYGSKKRPVSCLTSRENPRNHKKQKLKKNLNSQ